MEWISVKDRLPNDCESVLLYSKGFDIISGYLVYDLDGEPIRYTVNDWDESESTVSLDSVTHWRPFPEPPKD